MSEITDFYKKILDIFHLWKYNINIFHKWNIGFDRKQYH